MLKSDRLRRLVSAVLLLGAAGAIALMLRAGGHNPSRLLVLLFGIWVLSPFVAALGLMLVSDRWPAAISATVHLTTLVVALRSVSVYAAYVGGQFRAKAGFVFLMVPFASWVLLAASGAVALIRRRAVNSGRNSLERRSL